MSRSSRVYVESEKQAYRRFLTRFFQKGQIFALMEQGILEEPLSATAPCQDS
jgi:hypothetical protein